MRIIDAADYILGRKFTDSKKEHYRATKETMKLAKAIEAKHPTVRKNLELVDSHTVFYKLEPDVAKEVPTKMREEVFYGLKLDRMSPIIPAKGLYMLVRCYNLYKSISIFPKVFPENLLNEMFAENYCAEGYTLRDVICTVFDEQFKPLSAGELAVPNKKNWDIYIEETDMVAMIPDGLKQYLSNDDIKRLTVKGTDIMLGDKPIRFLGNYYGAVNSTYDLRGLV